MRSRRAKGAVGMDAWVRSQPPRAIRVIRNMLVHLRHFSYPRWWLAGWAAEVERLVLLRFAGIPGVDPEGLSSAIEAYLRTTAARRKDTGDPLNDPFAVRLQQLVDITWDPNEPGGTYRDWLRDRFERRRQAAVRTTRMNQRGRWLN